MGKLKIAQTLARAGLHLGSTTAGRILKESLKPPEEPGAPRHRDTQIVAKYPDHVYHIDLTAVPIQSGFWASWFPGSLPQCWPFCWWVAAVLDHDSRRVVAVGVFANKPDCRAVCTFLGRASRKRTPKHMICDRDSIFDCETFRKWAKRKQVRLRYGAVGQAREHCSYRAFLSHNENGIRSKGDDSVEVS